MENQGFQTASSNRATPPSWTAHEMNSIFDALKNLQFGSVEIFLQHGKVVQVDRKEKIRIDKEKNRS